MAQTRLGIDCSAVCEYRRILSLMPFCWAHELEIAVLVFVVVPAREAEHPGAGFLDCGKRPG